MPVLRCSPKLLNLSSLALLLASSIVNISLFIVLTVRFFKPQGCHEYSLQTQVEEDAKMLNNQQVYPADHSAYLSHVVMALHESGPELKSLLKTLAYWKRYPPCTHNGYPTNWAKAHATMVFLLDQPPSQQFAEAVAELYYDLPAAARSCFAGMEMRHAGVKSSNSTTNANLEELANGERDLFSAFVTNSIGLEEPSYALFLTPDTIPVQANWLNLMDYETRIPVERFWMKGSIYRGPPASSSHNPDDPRSLITMSKVALYNIGDPAFGKFYIDVVRPFIVSLATTSSDPSEKAVIRMPVEHDFTNYLFQFGHYRWARMMVALFRPTDAIQDYSGAPINVQKIQNDSPDTLMVKGQAPELTSSHTLK